MDASADALAHTPVLYHEVLSAFQPSAGSRYIDGTVGAAGHAYGILEASSPDGMLLGLDRDPLAIKEAARKLAAFAERALLRQGSFRRLKAQLESVQWDRVNGVLFDLGLSSMQLDEPGRGFSFQAEGPLDMRFDPTQDLTAEQIVNEWSEAELIQLLREYGEERYATRIVKTIIAHRPLNSTTQLGALIVEAVPGSRAKIHPATRTFQALRIAVNDELDALSEGLEQAVEVLTPGGRLAIIAFHSLEDRIVKRFLIRESADCLCPPEQLECSCGHYATLRRINRKPLRPTEREIAINPRSRSARLRVAERI